ncbi:hypothetical protein ACM66B_000789 [Microbotryomycetes sp. NB124-2]
MQDAPLTPQPSPPRSRTNSTSTAATNDPPLSPATRQSPRVRQVTLAATTTMSPAAQGPSHAVGAVAADVGKETLLDDDVEQQQQQQGTITGDQGGASESGESSGDEDEVTVSGGGADSDSMAVDDQVGTRSSRRTGGGGPMRFARTRSLRSRDGAAGETELTSPRQGGGWMSRQTLAADGGGGASSRGGAARSCTAGGKAGPSGGRHGRHMMDRDGGLVNVPGVGPGGEGGKVIDVDYEGRLTFDPFMPMVSEAPTAESSTAPAVTA